MKTATTTTTATAKGKYIVHEGCANTKNKKFVVLRGGESCAEAYKDLQGVGNGCIAAEFENGVFSLILKNHIPALAVPTGYVAHSTVPKNKHQTMGQTPELIGQFTAVRHCGDFEILMNAEKSLPLYEEVMEELIHLSPKELENFFGNAVIRGKQGSPIERAALKAREWVMKRMNMMDLGNASMILRGEQGFTYPKDFHKWVKDLIGLWFDIHTNTIKTITLHEFFFTTDMHLLNWAVFLGLRG